ncbi:hypothetical protein NM688_g5485 [Phlebia brevispora]|uniref:Uncharacterized protein n=1 Tax=Phlebia brevispora TaxID=194682 RepID=A0ACC1SUD2_9APHY|nr:hypothetical protein NM688_g5485 [Phlebia brevispora]
MLKEDTKVAPVDHKDGLNMKTFTKLHRTWTSGVVLILTVMEFSLAQELITFECFETGISSDCTSFIDTFCSSASVVSAAAQESIAMCFPLSTETRCDFNAWRGGVNSSHPPGPFSEATCSTILPIVSDACEFGGSGILVGFGYVFTTQANDGSCGAVTALPNPPT